MSGERLNVFRGISRGFTAFTKRICHTESPDLSNKIASAGVLGLILMLLLVFGTGGVYWVIGVIDDSRTAYRFDQLSPAEHLTQARAACGDGNECLNTTEAVRHLAKIPASAPEYADSQKLRLAINEQVAQSNLQGQTHDKYSCANSTENQPIISFDAGHSWFKDDGRCAARMQRRRDENAQLDSFWSTTVRADTDMNSSWLPDEERTCQTYPDDKGRVAAVTCDATPHETHNIPVVFWGGVDRNTVSNWKCRREKGIFDDKFVCRAID
jgi:hypothetical protein